MNFENFASVFSTLSETIGEMVRKGEKPTLKTLMENPKVVKTLQGWSIRQKEMLMRAAMNWVRKNIETPSK